MMSKWCWRSECRKTRIKGCYTQNHNIEITKLVSTINGVFLLLSSACVTSLAEGVMVGLKVCAWDPNQQNY